MSPKRSYKAQQVLDRMAEKLNRQMVGSFVACVHCGNCTEACHYVLSNPDDPTYAPAYKADRIRKLFKRHFDWTGRVFPWWVKAGTVNTDEDLEELKDIVFGKCTNCRRCSINCPMGVDYATFNRMARGLLVHAGVMPEGVAVVSKDQWEIGNQMGVLPEDYVETIEWMSEELVEEVGDESAEIPIDKKDADIVYTINPREVKYDPRSISDAAKIFWAAGANWTMPTEGWDMTNFGLFSGDDALGGAVAKRVYDRVRDLNGKKLVISECGHGYRSTACEGPNWAGTDIDFEMESSVLTMLRYIREGTIKVDKSKNPGRYTFHDSCNNARSCGLTEEPRELLKLVVEEFVEMYPNRAENFCCTGGGGAMSMSEYTPRRLKSAKTKADQLAATSAKSVVTSCHNCVDGLGDCIKHYEIDMEVTQLVNLVANALVLPEPKEEPAAEPVEAAKDEPAEGELLAGYKVLVIDDEPDVCTFLSTVLEDNGAEVYQATDADEGLALARKHKPDLITLDISMPGKDGGEVFEELRKDSELKTTPVCIVTGRPEMRSVIYDRDVRKPEGYLDKPVEEEALLRNARKILDLPRTPAERTDVADGSSNTRGWDVEALYRQYFDQMPSYVTVQDRDLRIVHANRSFREDFGESAERYCYQIYKHRSEPCEDCPVERTFRDGHRHTSEQRVRCLDGREVSVIVYTTPIRNDDGEIIAVMEMSTDITEVKRLQEQVQDSRTRYRQLFEEVPCHISIQDRDLRIIETNRRFRDDFGSHLGCKCYEVYKHRSEECIPCPVQQTFDDGEVHRSEEVVTAKDGSRMNQLVYSTPIRDIDGAIQAVMEMSTDITPIRQLQSQVESIGMLISSVSHGLKGLLTGLDGGRYLVNSGIAKGNDKRLHQGWEMVERNVDRIRGMVMNILYYAKERSPNWEVRSAADSAKEVCDLIQTRATEHGVELRCEVDDDAGELEADPNALRSLLVNLAENSVDACRLDKKKSGHVVTMSVQGHEDRVAFVLEDNGIGMDQETQDKAFTLFFSSKGSEGTGLGLFIANKIAQAHGGTIVLDSELDRGTRFVVEMPRRRPSAHQEAPVH